MGIKLGLLNNYKKQEIITFALKFVCDADKSLLIAE